MDADDILPLDIPPLYYVYLVLTTVHILVSSALFVWRRNIFPVKGHNAYLTIFFGVRSKSWHEFSYSGSFTLREVLF